MSKDIITNHSTPEQFCTNNHDLEYYKINLFAPRWIMTSGVLEECEKHKCLWILDVVASYVSVINKKSFKTYIDYLLIIDTIVDLKKSKAVFTISHEINQEKVVIIKQKIAYTNLTKNITWWAINETLNNAYKADKRTILLLPSEY